MPNHFSIAIIGAGPAGLGAATRAAKLKLSHVLFEKGEVGNTIYDYQLKKHVMAEPSRLPLRADISFREGKREEILQTWNAAISELGVNLQRYAVEKLVKHPEHFELFFEGGSVTATHVILAIGMQGSPRLLEVPGSKLPHVTYTLSDPDAFEDRDIVVVGAGDAAIENAVALSKKNKVTILNRSGEFARAKDGNVALITSAISAGKIRCFYDSEISRIEPESVLISSPQGEISIPCNHIIARLGCIMPRKFLESLGIAFPSADPLAVPVVNHRYESNVPNLFILGALIGYPLIKQAINQGYEVIEHIQGNPIEPADQVLIEEKLKVLSGDARQNLEAIRQALPLFQGLSDPQFRELITESTIRVKAKDETIFKRNDYTDSFFSIISGAVTVEITETKSKGLVAGEFFGEMGLISGRRRTATTRAAEDAILLETPRKQILKLISSVASVKGYIDRIFLIRALQTSIFPEADPKMLESILDRIQTKKFKKGEVLFRQGDLGDVLYVIRKGSVRVSRLNREGQDIVQTYIPAGNYVGEMAFLSPDPQLRSATVTAAVPCETILISKDDFLLILEQNPRERERVYSIAQARRVENIVQNQNSSHGALLDFIFTQGVTDADNFLMIDSNLCVSCDNCETACAATHQGYSRLDRKGGKSFASVQIPISCRHCENPLCMLDCPPDALSRQPNGEVVIKDSCIGCGNCQRNCPYGVIQMVYDKKGSKTFWGSLFDYFREEAATEKGAAKAAKCDMCHHLDGGPACVRSCPTGAAIRVNPSRLLTVLKERTV